jgi:hydrogenase large subunit
MTETSVDRGSRARLDPALLAELVRRHREAEVPADRFARIAGRLAFHATVDLRERRVDDAAAVATQFRGYETLLRQRSLRDAGRVSSTASGICGGVHATASALCLEMALGVAPPPLGIVLRNLLLSCQFLSDNPMHLFVLAGPDWGAAAVRRSDPAIWHQAERTRARHRELHGSDTVAALLAELDPPSGRWFAAAMAMVRRAREAYAVLGGKYPHSESFVPGGVALAVTADQLAGFERALQPFVDDAKRCVAIWDDVAAFFAAADPRYLQIGESPATMVDFGQWDREDHYDASYRRCDAWGEQRWSMPGAIVDGALVTTRLSELNAGLEEFVDRSYYEADRGAAAIAVDPLGQPISPHHPWNRQVVAAPDKATAADGTPYSWACATTWRRRVFEVGAYARVYLTALGGKLSASTMASTGRSLVLDLPAGELPAMRAEWTPPARWNALERIRARAHAVAFSLLVARENLVRARALVQRGERRAASELVIPDTGRSFGAGLCGAGRGFLAHWAVIEAGVLARYQIAVPSRINAAPRTPWGEPGPCEQAMRNTPVIESCSRDGESYDAIDLVRAIQSFDPCTASSAHVLIHGQPRWRSRAVTTDGT